MGCYQLRQRQIQILNSLVDFRRILIAKRHAIDACIVEREPHRRLPVRTRGVPAC